MFYFNHSYLRPRLLVCLLTVAFSGAACAQERSFAPKELNPVSGRAIVEGEILPGDVLSRVELTRAELELIRQELGKPAFSAHTARAQDTAPREVWFMANALHDKADRLAFEHVKTSAAHTGSIDTAAITPYHVWLMVNKTFMRLQAVKAVLNIPEVSEELLSPDSTTPSDVLQSMIRANQELGKLLSQQVAPADVFQQVTQAIHLNTQLLAVFEGTPRIPLPAFERRKTPDDVYRRMTRCLELIGKIAQLSDQPMLSVDTDSLYSGAIKPGDVYVLTTLVVAELSYLHALHGDTKPATQADHPGKKTPAHVFQRVGILQAQLEALLKAVQASPDWLKSS